MGFKHLKFSEFLDIYIYFIPTHRYMSLLMGYLLELTYTVLIVPGTTHYKVDRVPYQKVYLTNKII